MLIITLALLLDRDSRITTSSFASTCCSTDLGLGMPTRLGWLPMLSPGVTCWWHAPEMTPLLASQPRSRAWKWHELPLGDRNPRVIDGACTPSGNRWCAWNRLVACPVCMALCMPRRTAKLLCCLCRDGAVAYTRLARPTKQNTQQNKTPNNLLCVSTSSTPAVLVHAGLPRTGQISA